MFVSTFMSYKLCSYPHKSPQAWEEISIFLSAHSYFQIIQCMHVYQEQSTHNIMSVPNKDLLVICRLSIRTLLCS